MGTLQSQLLDLLLFDLFFHVPMPIGEVVVQLSPTGIPGSGTFSSGFHFQRLLNAFDIKEQRMVITCKSGNNWRKLDDFLANI